MIKSPGTFLIRNPLSSLKKVRDLQYFEGPLLSEFSMPSGHRYLLRWVDCSDQANRWMAFRVSEAKILHLTAGKISYRDTVTGAGDGEPYYFNDIIDDGEILSCSMAYRDEIPEEYFPAHDAKYITDIDPNERASNAFDILMSGNWDMSDLAEMPRLFGNIYSVLKYADQTPAPSSNAANFPWQGGYSAAHFYRYTSGRIPVVDRPRVDQIQYASPGFIRIACDVSTATHVAMVVLKYASNKISSDAAYNELEAFIREERLNQLNPNLFTSSQNSTLSSMALKLAAASHIEPGFPWMQAVTSNAFQAAKLLMTHFRRIRDLGNLYARGLISFDR